MKWSNYHGHSHYCDGVGYVEEYIQAAIEAGMESIGISSHAPLPFSTLWAMKKERLSDYLNEVEQAREAYKDKIQVYTSLEIDFIPELIGPGQKEILALQLDYTVGSVHYVDQFPDGTHFEVDGSRQVFLDAIQQIFSGDVEQLVKRYFYLVRLMLATQPPTLLGHLDKLKIHNTEGQLFDEQSQWYRTEIEQTLDLLATTDTILEVNTRGIYKKKCDTTYPSVWVLEEACNRGIPVTINSDAHHPRELIAGFDVALDNLKKAGYTTMSQLYDGEWKAISL